MVKEKEEYLAPLGVGEITIGGRRWRRYRDGIDIIEAGVHIIKRINDGSQPKATKYDITYLCCGEATTLNHLQIRQRMNKGRVNCLACGKKIAAKVGSKQAWRKNNGGKKEEPAKETEEPMAFRTGPKWPVPNYINADLIGIWEDFKWQS